MPSVAASTSQRWAIENLRSRSSIWVLCPGLMIVRGAERSAPRTIIRPGQRTQMLERLLKFSIAHRWLVLAATLGMAAFGAYNYRQLPIDAVPDITNVQVQINTEAPGYSPLEAEQRITFLVETAMAGLPHLSETRSISRYGLSQVTVIFDDGTDIYFARQLVNERIQEASSNLPPGIVPSMGPIATGLGEIFLWSVEAKPDARSPEGRSYDGMDLRT